MRQSKSVGCSTPMLALVEFAHAERRELFYLVSSNISFDDRPYCSPNSLSHA